MEDAALEPFRIYCLCGQKMRVAPEMHGKPGKCVACRQRIRVPRLEELPEDCREIYLKDHPEFLRPQPAPKKGSSRSKDTPSLALASFTPAPGAPAAPEGRPAIEPLDILESLQLVCSFDYIVHKKLDEFRDGQPPAPVHPDKNALMRYRGLAHKARERLDEAMRASLEQASAELANVNEQAARAMLAVRVGDMDYEGYVAAAGALRERREWLERRKRNLQGWLTVKDPYRAGGLLPVRFEDVPSGDLELPPEEEADGETPPLLHRAVESLRTAYAALAKAELHLRERERLRQENRVGGANLEGVRADRVAARERAQAAIEFHRNRLKQLAQDIDNDLKGIEAHLDVARKRFQAGQCEETAYHAIEMRLLKAQSDNGQAAALAHRALLARSAREVPHPEGTFLQRLVRPDKMGVRAFGVDSYLLWAAGVAMAANLMPLAIAAQDGADMLFVRGIAVAMFLGAFVSGAIGAVPNRRTRGGLVLFLWPVMAGGGAHCIQELWWGMDPLGAALRADPFWYFKPAIAIYAVAVILIGAAGGWALFAFKGWRWAPIPLVTGVLVGAVAILTDGFGAFSPSPSVEGPEIAPVTEQPGWYQATFTVRNAGARAVWLGGVYPKEPSAARVTAERQREDGQWTLAATPSKTKPPKAPQWLKQNESPVAMLMAGETAAVQFLLPPGEYRMRLMAKLPAEFESLLPFSVGGDGESGSEQPDTAAPSEAPVSTAQEVSATQTGQDAEVRLRGVLAGEGHGIVLQIDVTAPGLDPVSSRINLGDAVYGSWRAEEYSASTNKLTLSDGTRVLVLATGDTLRLPAPSEGESGRI